MLSPADQLKLKALTQEVERALGKSKFAEFMDLNEKSEDEQDEQGEGGMPMMGQNAQKVYPNQGK